MKRIVIIKVLRWSQLIFLIEEKVLLSLYQYYLHHNRNLRDLNLFRLIFLWGGGGLVSNCPTPLLFPKFNDNIFLFIFNFVLTLPENSSSLLNIRLAFFWHQHLKICLNFDKLCKNGHHFILLRFLSLQTFRNVMHVIIEWFGIMKTC